MAHEEYLRRNLLVCKAVGAKASALHARDLLLTRKRPPKWLLKSLQGIIDRVEPLPIELAAWRNASQDAPERVRNTVPTTGEPK